MISIRKKEGDVTNYLSEENRKLRDTVSMLKRELDVMKEPPLLVCDVLKIMNNKAIVRLPNGSHFFVNVSPLLVGKIDQGDRVLAEQKSLVLIDKMGKSKTHEVEDFLIVDRPNVGWDKIGGLKNQVMEIKEVIELPLKRPDLFKKVGILPPKGILLHGPSGTGKTLLARAVAASTNSTFIEIVGSELVQKFIGEGAKLVKDIFKLAKEKAPSIIFIDEIDSIASERVDVGTSGEREVQRTFMQLLSEIDGFNNLSDVKIIGATNRPDILDQAILRPGRLDRLIEIPYPEIEERTEIFKIHTKNMGLESVDLEHLASITNNFSGAEIRAVCTEAGYFAIRSKRLKTLESDFLKAIKKVKNQEEDRKYKNMFG
jgi:proteasome regulatory subunit